MNRLLLISGAIGVGKSAISNILEKEYGFEKISSSSFLREKLLLSGMDVNRRNMQDLGDQYDVSTNYTWVVDDVALPLIKSESHKKNWLLDAVRKPEQVSCFKDRFPNSAIHVHLSASEFKLKERYSKKIREDGLVSYEEAKNHPNEVAARSLVHISDIVIETDEMSEQEVINKIRAFCEDHENE